MAAYVASQLISIDNILRLYDYVYTRNSCTTHGYQGCIGFIVPMATAMHVLLEGTWDVYPGVSTAMHVLLEGTWDVYPGVS